LSLLLWKAQWLGDTKLKGAGNGPAWFWMAGIGNLIACRLGLSGGAGGEDRRVIELGGATRADRVQRGQDAVYS